MATFPTPILLATDGSPDARLATRAAIDLQRRTRAALHLVHAWDNYYGMGGMMPVAYPLIQEDGARQLLEEETVQISAAGATVSGAHLAQGPAVDSILDVAETIRAQLILVGSHGFGGMRRLVLGSVSEGIVHHAQVPVLVMRGGDSFWPPRRIVVGDDASPEALQALHLAEELAGLFGGGLTLVRAMPHIERVLEDGHNLEQHVVDDVLEFAQGELEDHRDTLADDVRARATLHISVDAAGEALVEAAREPGTMVAVGCRGQGAMQRLRHGSVSTAVLHGTTGPVLIAPHARVAVAAAR